MGFGVCPPTCYTSYLLVRTPQLFALNSCLELGWTLGAPTRDVPRPALRSLRDLRALPTGRFRRCFMWRAQWRDALGVARQMADVLSSGPALGFLGCVFTCGVAQGFMDNALFLRLRDLGGGSGLMGLGRAVMCVSEVRPVGHHEHVLMNHLPDGLPSLMACHR